MHYTLSPIECKNLIGGETELNRKGEDDLGLLIHREGLVQGVRHNRLLEYREWRVKPCNIPSIQNEICHPLSDDYYHAH